MRMRIFSRESASGRRVGKHVAIPILLLLCGLGLITVASWNLISQTYFLSKVMIQPNVTVQPDGKLAAGERKVKFPKLGEQFGNLSIPSAKIEYPVLHGDYDEELARGIGHFDGSKYPGEGANIVLDGHRETVFRNLGKVKIGDPITFTTTYGVYKYEVTDIKIVKDTDNSILRPTDTERLTLYTCYPFDTIGYKPERYVVMAKLTEGTPLKELLIEKGS